MYALLISTLLTLSSGTSTQYSAAATRCDRITNTCDTTTIRCETDWNRTDFRCKGTRTATRELGFGRETRSSLLTDCTKDTTRFTYDLRGETCRPQSTTWTIESCDLRDTRFDSDYGRIEIACA